eukprot:SAG22_NODE_7755_length_711_cov_0.872549_2_plen_157_part_01
MAPKLLAVWAVFWTSASSAAPPPPPQLLYSANFSAALDWVAEEDLLSAAGQRRVRLPPNGSWVLESGAAEPSPLPAGPSTASTAGGAGLVLENRGSHCTLWLNKPFPPQFELRFGVVPANASQGLNIVFFGASAAAGGGSIFALDMPPRRGNYSLYT